MRRWTGICAALASLLTPLGVPGQASASVVTSIGGVLTITAGADEENHILIAALGTGIDPHFSVGDTGAPLTYGSGCSNGCDPASRIVADMKDRDDTIEFDSIYFPPNYQNSLIQGGAGNDVISGGEQIDVLNGGPGQDTLTGGPGDDQLNGDTGFDTLFGGDGGDRLSGGDQDDLLLGGPASDILSGGAGNDRLDSPPTEPAPADVAGNDELRGDGGDDLFLPAAGGITTNGIDTFFGGEGRDTADYSTVSTSLALSEDGLANDGGPGDPDNLQPDVEVLIGGPLTDVLAGGDLDNALDGRGGDDLISGNGGNDLLIGGDADIGSDTLRGGEGHDQLLGGPGDDGLEGGPGNDTLQSGPGTDSLGGGSGDDVIEGGPGVDGLAGGDGNDILRGGALDLIGGDSADNVDGDAGNDVLEGDLGDDSLDGGSGADVLRGGAGDDTAEYDKRASPIIASLDDRANDGEAQESDNVGRDVENMRTGTRQDDLIGSQASNGLASGEGEDYLDGAAGVDALSGGADRDTVRARDGVADRVSCGGDVDFAIVDTRDEVDKDCERVDRGRRNRPRLARSAVTTPVRGKLRLNVRGTKRFVPLQDRVNIPFGSAVDASDGAVRLTSVQRPRGRRNAVATLSDGAFRTSQRRSSRPVTDIRLAGGDFDACRPSARRESRARKRRVIRELLGKGKGRFSTRGRYSATTVRGTTWVVEDRCDGTLTRVRSGSAEVEDFVRNKTVIVNAGESYLAGPRR